MNRRSAANTVVSFFVLSIIAACSSGPATEVHRYLLRDGPESPEKTGRHLRIARVDVAAHLDGIVIHRPGYAVDTLVYHRWAAPLSAMVARAARNHLRAQPDVGPILLPDDPGSADAEVHLRLVHFEIEDSGTKTSNAVAEVEIKMHLDGDPRRLVSGSVRKYQAVGGQDAESLVQALDQALHDALADLAGFVHQALK